MKIALFGFGKMNREVFNLAKIDDMVNVTSILRPNADKADDEPTEVFVSDDPQKVIEMCEVVVDFSVAHAVRKNVEVAAKFGKNVVIGTTGIGSDDREAIRLAIEQNRTSGVISPNFSIGVNIFLQAAEFLSKKLSDYDVEMIDIHHKAKKDAPSGTALRTLEAINRGKIPVHSLRIGDVIGDHAVVFGGNAERIELWHKATSRRCFAQGALFSAKWLQGKQDGKLHEFKELLSNTVQI